MSNAHHHGLHSFHGKNILCTMKSYEVEKVGRFGRLFRSLSPLYIDPTKLGNLGAIGGPMDGGNTPDFTNNVPLGMIFLGQFIDHDITFDTSSNFSRINRPGEIENIRTPTLDLDCVFGGGPEDEPFLYDNPNSRGLYLLTGKTNRNINQNSTLEKQDLPRTGTGTAIIGDPRNDENRVISQLQLAFIRFYNALYEDVRNADPTKAPIQIYEEARQLATWHYQWVVVNEFLPILCGTKIVSEVLSTGRKYYKPCNEPFIPVEFSVAAYRFGHSMISQSLRLQPTGNIHSIFSPQFGQGFSRISDPDQIIDWEVFFDFNGSFQKAEKLDSKMASILLNLPFINSPNPGDKSLASRNLRRGQSFLLPSGEAVAEFMNRDQNEIDDVKNLINNLTTPHTIDLSSGSPLWLYILAEAEEIGRVDTNGNSIRGEGLGPIGATIVAEVIIGLLELDEHSYLGNNRDWIPTLGSNGVFTMKDLIDKSLTAIEL